MFVYFATWKMCFLCSIFILEIVFCIGDVFLGLKHGVLGGTCKFIADFSIFCM